MAMAPPEDAAPRLPLRLRSRCGVAWLPSGSWSMAITSRLVRMAVNLGLHVGQVVAGQQWRGQHGPHGKVRAVLGQRQLAVAHFQHVGIVPVAGPGIVRQPLLLVSGWRRCYPSAARCRPWCATGCRPGRAPTPTPHPTHTGRANRRSAVPSPSAPCPSCRKRQSSCASAPPCRRAPASPSPRE